MRKLLDRLLHRSINLADLNDNELGLAKQNLSAFGNALTWEGYDKRDHWWFPAINGALDLCEDEQSRRLAC